jgi:hypothetical protein
MKRSYAYILCCITLISCIDKTVTSSQTTYKKIVNKSFKNLYYEIFSVVDDKNLFVNSSDSSELKFYRENNNTKVIIGGTVRLEQIIIKKERLYNLTDTTLFEYNIEYTVIPPTGNTKEEQVYSNHLIYTLGKESTDINSVIIIKLIVDDSVLEIMKKDYSMLDKFKEYYKK